MLVLKMKNNEDSIMAKKYKCVCNKCDFKYEIVSGTNGIVIFHNYFCNSCKKIDTFELKLKDSLSSNKRPTQCYYCQSENIFEIKEECPNCNSMDVTKKLGSILC